MALLPFCVINAENLSKKELKQVEKDAKKAAKEYAGWKVLPGALPLQRQLAESYKMQFEREDGEPKYILGEGNTVAQSYNVAKLQSIEAAKFMIAGAIESEMIGLIESAQSNKELSTADAATISKMVSGTKSKVAQSLGRISTIVELYQDLPNKTVRVMVRLAYSSQRAREIAKRIIHQELEDESSELKDKVDELVDW